MGATDGDKEIDEMIVTRKILPALQAVLRLVGSSLPRAVLGNPRGLREPLGQLLQHLTPCAMSAFAQWLMGSGA
jgi:hypothetical protein